MGKGKEWDLLLEVMDSRPELEEMPNETLSREAASKYLEKTMRYHKQTIFFSAASLYLDSIGTWDEMSLPEIIALGNEVEIDPRLIKALKEIEWCNRCKSIFKGSDDNCPFDSCPLDSMRIVSEPI